MRIDREAYSSAFQRIVGHQKDVTVSEVGHKVGHIVVTQGARRLYVDVAGKNLPYDVGFVWETHITEKRLTELERVARQLKAEPWLGICYLILKSEYKHYFRRTITVNYDGEDLTFGAKMVSAETYRKNMQRRAHPKYGVVDLPRHMVPELLSDPEDVLGLGH